MFVPVFKSVGTGLAIAVDTVAATLGCRMKPYKLSGVPRWRMANVGYCRSYEKCTTSRGQCVGVGVGFVLCVWCFEFLPSLSLYTLRQCMRFKIESRGYPNVVGECRVRGLGDRRCRFVFVRCKRLQRCFWVGRNWVFYWRFGVLFRVAGL